MRKTCVCGKQLQQNTGKLALNVIHLLDEACNNIMGIQLFMYNYAIQCANTRAIDVAGFHARPFLYVKETVDVGTRTSTHIHGSATHPEKKR